MMTAGLACAALLAGAVQLDAERVAIGRHLELRLEDGAPITPEQAFLGTGFVQSTSDEPNLGVRGGVVWGRFQTEGGEGDPYFFLRAGSPRPNRIDLYSRRDDGTVIHASAGLDVGLSSGEVMVPLDARAHLHVMRVEAKPARINLDIVSNAGLLDVRSRERTIAGVSIGIFVALFFYSLLLGVALRDPSRDPSRGPSHVPSHVLYCALLLCTAGYFSMRDGLLPPLDFILARGGGMTITVAVMLVFARRFLSLRERHPRIDRVLRAQLVLTCAVVALALVDIDVAVPSMAAVVVSLGVVVAAGVVARGDDRAATIFLAAVSVLVACAVPGGLHAVGVVDAGPLAGHALRVGASIAMILLALALAERLRAASAAHENAALAARLDAQSEFTARVLDAEERERARFAQQLHDGIGHALLGVKERLRRAARNEESIPPDQADEIAKAAQSCIDDARAMARDLAPPSLRALGVVAAVRAVLHEQPGVELEVDVGDDETALDKRLGARSIHLVRIVQEALSNAVRHGQAKMIKVSLFSTEAGFRLELVDDGPGTPPDAAPGLGLLGMEQRAKLLGCALTVDRAPGGGTRVVCKSVDGVRT